jgi:hypothetical protein
MWVDSMIVGLFVAGGINILWLGIYGFYIPSNIRVGLSVPMAATNLSLALFGSLLTVFRLYGAKKTNTVSWGNLSVGGYFTLLIMAMTVTWIIGLGGYIRSSVRQFWHITEIIRDTSPWAFTHPIGFAANVIAFNALLFWFGMVFIFWLVKPSQASQSTT